MGRIERLGDAIMGSEQRARRHLVALRGRSLRLGCDRSFVTAQLPLQFFHEPKGVDHVVEY